MLCVPVVVHVCWLLPPHVLPVLPVVAAHVIICAFVTAPAVTKSLL